MNIGKNNPRGFWELINKMNNWGKETREPSNNITPEKWKKHFLQLLNNEERVNTEISIYKSFDTFDPILDSRFTLKEMREAITELKAGKAPGPDRVLMEYLKIFGYTYDKILLNLVNNIFSTHIYPSKWNLNFLKPIYKTGDVDDLDNYRGLAVGPAFAKLFSILLLKRLTKYIDTHNLISPNQIGFLKNKCTSDHIFLLQTVVEKVVKKGKGRLYVAFIDFKKAYDTVNRDKLLDRLNQVGISGLFLKNIESMYQKTKYSVKYKGGYLNALDSNLGLRQGCPLSPMLFNIYIDDISEIFNEKCDPVIIQDIKIHHFLYADDLVLVSTTPEGLQVCLDVLYAFSVRKDLSINLSKSKTMIFNLAGRLIKKKFTINDKELETVHTFCYLGFDFKPSGTVKCAMNTLYDKACKAMRPLMCVIARFNIPVKTSVKLFHTYISPIMLYNYENWATLTNKKIESVATDSIFADIADSKTDTLHRKFLKYILGVSKSCPNVAVYGETGEIPLSLKGYGLLLNYWYRISHLHDDTLVKIALKENVKLRTNWILTVENLIRYFNLSDTIDTPGRFKKFTKDSIQKKYKEWWAKSLSDADSVRLNFYRSIKHTFMEEKYLELPHFSQRRVISKFKCSDHRLEIEIGRHKKPEKTPRERRFCRICNDKSIETEEHFLTECKLYDQTKAKYNVCGTEIRDWLINNLNLPLLGQYLSEAFELRNEYLNNTS